MITLLVILLLIGVGLYFVARIPAVDGTILQLIRAVGIIIAILLIVSFFFPGSIPGMRTIWR